MYICLDGMYVCNLCMYERMYVCLAYVHIICMYGILFYRQSYKVCEALRNFNKLSSDNNGNLYFNDYKSTLRSSMEVINAQFSNGRFAVIEKVHKLGYIVQIIRLQTKLEVEGTKKC